MVSMGMAGPRQEKARVVESPDSVRSSQAHLGLLISPSSSVSPILLETRKLEQG